MSYFSDFLAVYPILCFFMVIGAICAIIIPNHICNTTSTGKHWFAVLLIISGLTGMRNIWQISLLILAVILVWFVVRHFRFVKNKQKVITLPNTQPIDLLKRVK